MSVLKGVVGALCFGVAGKPCSPARRRRWHARPPLIPCPFGVSAPVCSKQWAQSSVPGSMRRPSGAWDSHACCQGSVLPMPSRNTPAPAQARSATTVRQDAQAPPSRAFLRHVRISLQPVQLSLPVREKTLTVLQIDKLVCF